MTTIKQDADFKQAVIPEYLLNDAVAWIKHNLSPEDVFTTDQLTLWAAEQGLKAD